MDGAADSPRSLPPPPQKLFGTGSCNGGAASKHPFLSSEWQIGRSFVDAGCAAKGNRVGSASLSDKADDRMDDRMDG